MKQPNAQVIRGLEVLQPVLSILLECPNDSELQEVSENELIDAEAAYEWIVGLLTQHDHKTNKDHKAVEAH